MKNIMDYIKDPIQDLTLEIAREVYDKHDKIIEEVQRRMTEDGYHADDDVDVMDQYISDYIQYDIIEEKLHGTT